MALFTAESPPRMTHPGCQFEEGTKLRYPIFDDRGVLLLSADAVLTRRIISILGGRDIRLKLHAVAKVLEGGPEGQEIRLKGPTVKIGRDPDCQIRPNSRLVSSNHCVIEFHPISVVVTDCGSTNGTLLNGQRLDEPRTLKDGDLLTFGSVTLRILLYADLETDAMNSDEVAGLILTRADERVEEPPAGSTWHVAEEDGKHIAELLNAAYAKKCRLESGEE